MKINDFHSFNYIYLFIIPILLILYFVFLSKYRRSALNYSNLEIFKKLKSSAKLKYKNKILRFLRISVLALIIIALMRPRYGQDIAESITESVDIMIVLDISGSMQAEDFKPKNRLEAAKQVAVDFIKGRKYDRIGLIQFGRGAFLKCPLTTDYSVLIDFIEKTNFEYKWEPLGFDYIRVTADIHNGTFIASALGTAVYHLKDSEAKSKVAILITDGEQEGDSFDPVNLAQVAAQFNIKVYTVSIGVKNRKVPFPIVYKNQGKKYMTNPDGSYPEIPVDEELLKNIAKITKAEFFRATDTNSLRNIFKKIDELEKTEIKVKKYVNYKEYFQIFLAAALIILFIEYLLRLTIFFTIPDE
ncbi:MAG TPA: VWA domain-containing protein [bacterium]|nr:VWA domain-containing protein [bacterium]HPP86798.1 VWA domain-containing protein [bacterium]